MNLAAQQPRFVDIWYHMFFSKKCTLVLACWQTIPVMEIFKYRRKTRWISPLSNQNPYLNKKSCSKLHFIGSVCPCWALFLILKSWTQQQNNVNDRPVSKLILNYWIKPRIFEIILKTTPENQWNPNLLFLMLKWTIEKMVKTNFFVTTKCNKIH